MTWGDRLEMFTSAIAAIRFAVPAGGTVGLSVHWTDDHGESKHVPVFDGFDRDEMLCFLMEYETNCHEKMKKYGSGTKTRTWIGD